MDKTFILVVIVTSLFVIKHSYAESVDVSLPIAYTSDNWLTTNSTSWAEESARRDKALEAYLSDDDVVRADKYGFRRGQTPKLAWNWFDQHPVGYGGLPYVLLQTLLSLDPVTETNPHLLTLAKIWRRKSVINAELGDDRYTLDHLGFGPHPKDYIDGIAKAPEQRQQKLPNGLVYDPTVVPEPVLLVDVRLRFMRDGIIGGLMHKFDPSYEPQIAELLVLATSKIRNRLYGHEIDYEKDIDFLQEPPKTDAVSFACSACHMGRVIVDGKMDVGGNIVTAGKMKFLPGMPNTELEAQYYSKLLMQSGLVMVESGFSLDADTLPRDISSIKPSKTAVLALFRRMLTRAIDPKTVGSIYGPSPEQIRRAKLQTYWVAKNFPAHIGDMIGVAIKTQYIYHQVAKKYAFNPQNPLKKTPDQVVPDVMGNRIGQMDAFGIASGLVSLHTWRKDNSYLKFMFKDNPQNPIFSGISMLPGFERSVGIKQAGERIRKQIAVWVPPVPAPVDVKSLNWSGHRALANWDGNQGASARTLASGTSATGDPLKVNVKIHEPLNPLINNMPPSAYPFVVDRNRALLGKAIFQGFGLPKNEKCSGCHKPNSSKIYTAQSLQVDENRTLVNTEVSRYGLATLVMEACNIFMRKNPDNDWCLPRDDSGNVITDWTVSNDDFFKDTPVRVRNGTNGYKADMLHGVWGHAPYLHNGSVPTLMHLLCADARPTQFKRGILFYDQDMVGFEWAVAPKQRYSPHEVQQVKTYDTREFGRVNTGHYFGQSLCPDISGLDPIADRYEITERVLQSKVGDLLEYLKTL